MDLDFTIVATVHTFAFVNTNCQDFVKIIIKREATNS